MLNPKGYDPFEKRDQPTIDPIKKEFKKLQDIRKLLMRLGSAKASHQDSVYGSTGFWRGKRNEFRESIMHSKNPISIWKRK